MAGRKSIGDANLRKQVLLLESNLNRLVLDREWGEVKAATAWVGKSAQRVRQASPLLLLLAPLAGLLMARSTGRSKGLLPILFAALRWIQPLRELWRRYSETTARTKNQA